MSAVESGVGRKSSGRWSGVERKVVEWSLESGERRVERSVKSEEDSGVECRTESGVDGEWIGVENGVESGAGYGE